ncbi:HWE histidine kinase domain-containing protein [Amorphus coralli]|uniref:HWE histidine kinase domain-containing protein n=1 Tax=Amorphus coralli TaxID=340680 RepID=UPI0003625180|nr:HWE histidine kinase domain-containing protein [Amorphus coralli]
MPQSDTGGPAAVDLTNCDREPIHIPGSIQPHGCLLVCEPRGGVVLRHSANAGAMLGLEGRINGLPLHDLFDDSCVHALRNAETTSSDASRPALLFALEVAPGRSFDVSLHRSGEIVIIEFEPAMQAHQPLQLTREMVGRVGDIEDEDQLMDKAARLIRSALGYDRVMIYRFEEDGAGKVISEVKRSDLESFLGQYFPASDIPKQARALYLANTIRIISNVDFERIPLVPEIDDAGNPLDLSFAHLRSVSPVHCEYLRNMGVSASMSISVILDGSLWGLIACHHYSPRILPMGERVAAEMFGDFFSLHLNTLKQKHRLNTATAARASLDRFLRRATHRGDIAEMLSDSLPDFATLVPCDGVGLWLDGSFYAHGATPPAEAVPDLAEHVSASADGRVWSTHALSTRLSPAGDYAPETSGVLAIPLSQIPRDYLFFFRKELVQTLDWAGNPDKSYDTGPLGDRLTPRKSFAIWKETVRAQSQPWTESEREIAEEARAAMVEIVLRQNELMAEERRKSDVRQRMLNQELNHRVKNILAIIKSLVGHPVDQQQKLADYVEALKGRLQALSFAHDQVVRGDGGGMLVDLLDAELSPYRSPTTATRLDGPGLWLDGRAFSVLALVLHELATNSAKYGALSQPGGELLVSWQLDQDGDCTIDWREVGGPPVEAPSRSGFGSALINRSIPYDLGGRSSVDYAESGVRAELVIPARFVEPTLEPGRSDGTRSTIEAAPASLSEHVRVLLVEDHMLIAMDVEASLEDHGLSGVMTTASSAEALEKLRTTPPDVAVLDVNLGEETSIPVAQELARRGIPFVFATGYGDGSMIPSDFAAVPVVRKPYEVSSLISALASVLSPTAH